MTHWESVKTLVHRARSTKSQDIYTVEKLLSSIKTNQVSQ